ncbi:MULTISPECIES: hypothetical protein, partial [unclassified Mucilaginibacter]|uniref:hypothetical protein n=1 Tax=unclassified Mucilaginibacter TaxID=2617802 RepID=UPI0033960F83
RIRWKVYVRFGGEYMETYYSDIARRWVLSLHYIITQSFIMQICKLMVLTLKSTDAENATILFQGIPESNIIETIRERVLEARKSNKIYELN